MTVYTPGSLVNARGRDWVVLPGSDDGLLVARPLGGGDDEIAAILTELEKVEAATFPPPQATDAGNAVSAGLLRDRAAGRLPRHGRAVSLPGRARRGARPYQLVPLLMALRQETVRLLIADDVGIGKTIEAGLDRRRAARSGQRQRLTVLCCPALAEQWQQELASKFGIDAELVLPSTVKRLQKNLMATTSRSSSVTRTHRVHRLHQVTTDAGTTSCVPAPTW